MLCRKLELFGGELVAIDSTKIKGQNAKGRNYSAAKVQALLQEAEKKVSAYLAELDESDAEEGRRQVGRRRPERGGVKREDRAVGGTQKELRVAQRR